MVVADGVGASLDWPELYVITHRLGAAAVADGAPDVVVGVLRGGMVPAVLLAHMLDLRDVRAVDVTHTAAEGINADKTHVPVWRNPASLGDLTGRDVLVVDDVAGSGATLASSVHLAYEAGAGRVRTAVCTVNEVNWAKATDRQVDEVLTYVGARCKGWVIFPWER
jgi:uncharacterized protein